MSEKMLKPEENLVAVVKRIELAEKGKAKITFNTKYGEYDLKLREDLARILWVGDRLDAKMVLTPSSMTDFIGYKPEPGDAVTVSYSIAYLKTRKGKVIYDCEEKLKKK